MRRHWSRILPVLLPLLALGAGCNQAQSAPPIIQPALEQAAAGEAITLVLKDEIPNPNALKIKTVLNGETMQDWTTEDMIFDVRTLIAFLSGSTTLLPGSVIMTGTPHGVGAARKPPVFLKASDTVTIEIEKIGQLTNPVIDEA